MSDFAGRIAAKQAAYRNAEDMVRTVAEVPVLLLLAYAAWVVILA